MSFEETLRNNKETCEAIIASRCIKTLTEHLSGQDQGLRDSAALAVLALSDLNSMQESQEFMSEGLLEALGTLLQDSREGMSITAACILHSYYRRSTSAKARVITFDEGRLLSRLVEMMSSLKRLSLLNLHISHLRDILLDDDGSVIPSNASRLKSTGLSSWLSRVEKEVKPQADQRINITELGFTPFVLASISQLRHDLKA
jgi:hypothetical protein